MERAEKTTALARSLEAHYAVTGGTMVPHLVALRRATAGWIGAAYCRLAPRCSAAAKRALDIGASGLLLVLGSPLLAAVALAIRLTDNGPVLYWQTRVGRHGREFRFPKFRSMAIDAERNLSAIAHLNQHGQGVTFKMKHDPRVTSIGRILRRFSLDELPQLWCVFVGQMSLVGPRPAVPREVAQYTVRDRVRLETVPGLTCSWQVSGRADIPFDRQVELDRDYVLDNNLLVDLKLLAKTVPAVLTGKGSY